MTREEAIAILEEEAEFLYGEDKPHNRTAFDMAIKALSVPEREKGTDETLVYNADGHFYGVMGGDAIMERIRGKADETNN